MRKSHHPHLLANYVPGNNQDALTTVYYGKPEEAGTGDKAWGLYLSTDGHDARTSTILLRTIFRFIIGKA